MSVNSSVADFSVSLPPLSSNSSSSGVECSRSRTGILILTAFSIANIVVLLPLSSLVLFFGYQRWRQHRSGSAAGTSNSDLFAYHLVAMDTITVAGSLVYCVGAYVDGVDLMMYSLKIFSTTWSVKINFHSLTCVECYLAVVHPVTYLRLKNTGGVRIRNVSIGIVWLLCVVWASLAILTGSTVEMILYFSFVSSALVIVCFCSLSVLQALRRPRPGDGGERKDRVDPMKRRAFHTIVTIMAVLSFGLGGMLVCDALEASELMSVLNGCVLVSSALWFSLPSSLVLPLLFLHRAGKLPGWNQNTESG